jgi:hypothetical protein
VWPQLGWRSYIGTPLIIGNHVHFLAFASTELERFVQLRDRRDVAAEKNCEDRASHSLLVRTLS